jgi:hypothetical protein
MKTLQTCIKIKACTDAAGGQPPCNGCENYIPRPGTTESINNKQENRMKNKLTDLNDTLFAQLDRLNNDKLSADALDLEITRAQAICGVSTQIINNGNLALKAHTALNIGMTKKAPVMFGIEDKSHG